MLWIWKIQSLWMDNMNDWEFVWNRIGRRGGREDKIGGKAAPDGVAIGIILICGEGGVGSVLWGDLLWIIIVWNIFIKDSIIIGYYWGGKGSKGPPTIAQPIWAGVEGEALFYGDVIPSYGGILNVKHLLYVGCVEHASARV